MIFLVSIGAEASVGRKACPAPVGAQAGGDKMEAGEFLIDVVEMLKWRAEGNGTAKSSSER